MAKLVAIYFLLFTLVNICSSFAPFHINPTASQLAEPLSLRHVQILKVIHERFIECFTKQTTWNSINRGQTNIFLLQNVELDVRDVTELDNFFTEKPTNVKVKLPKSLKSPDKLATLMKKSLSRLKNGLIPIELAKCIRLLRIEPGQVPNMTPVFNTMDKLKAEKSGQLWWSAMDKTMKILKYVMDQFPNTPLEEMAAVVDSFCEIASQVEQRALQERAKAAKYPGLCYLIQQWDNIEAVPNAADEKTTFFRFKVTSGTIRPRDEPDGDPRPNKKMSISFLNN